MCLAVPGQIMEVVEGDSEVNRNASIDMQGSRLDASLALTPEAKVGDWVLVHAGFAIQILSEEDAQETWEYLQECLADPNEDHPAEEG